EDGVLLRGGHVPDEIGSHVITARVPTFLTDESYDEVLGYAFPDSGQGAKRAVLGIDVHDENGGVNPEVNRVTVAFEQVGNDQDFTPADLMPLTQYSNSGLSLYRDANNNGLFDAVDVHVTLAEVPVFVANEANLIPLDTQNIESDNEIPDKPDYFVVIEIGPGASPGDDFRFKIPEYGVSFTDGTASGQTRRTAELIVIDEASRRADQIYTYRSSFLMLYGDTFNDGFPVYFTVTDYFTFNGIDS
ncbi:MAG: hypothetical protein GY869_32055, partial [Planctomycetes bacterium]|nr:hypothetical protein [Planctomycetota bacterium]